MPSERDDPSRYGVTEDTDPAILVGALGDERTGLDEAPQPAPAEEATDAPAGAGGLAAPPPVGLPASGSGNIPVPESMRDADPAMLAGALADERTGLDEEREVEPTGGDDVAQW